PVVNTMVGTTVVTNTTAAPTTQTWTVTATEAATGCTNTMTTAPVTIQPAFLAPTTTASTHCGNQVPTASAADPNGFTTPNFNWYAAATLGTALQSSTANTFGSVIGTTTTLYVTTTNPATGCQSDATPVVVTVAAPPALTLSSATLTTCDGVASPTLTVTGPAYDAFSWSPAAGVSGNATAFVDAGEEVFVSAAAINGPHLSTATITIPMTASVGVTRMRVVNVETTLVTGITPCGTYGYGETEDYIVNIQGVPAAVYTYAWNTTPAITGTTGTTVAVNTGANDLTANYVVTATDVATGCFTNMTTNNITVRPTPVVNAGQDVLVCSNNATEQVTLTATGAGPSGTYAWTGPVTGVVNGTPFTVGATGTFVVLGTTQYGCIDTDTLLVTYSTVPPASAGVDQAICFGQTATFAATGLAPYNWTMTNYANS
ncbi:MAG: hypothetical protein EB003_12925, partial [Flavobacteriia bacterium]|nr:hypothetical protein [Flavobacteriia bacterium]